jgi:hypothetical protein
VTEDICSEVISKTKEYAAAFLPPDLNPEMLTGGVVPVHAHSVKDISSRFMSDAVMEWRFIGNSPGYDVVAGVCKPKKGDRRPVYMAYHSSKHQNEEVRRIHELYESILRMELVQDRSHEVRLHSAPAVLGLAFWLYPRHGKGGDLFLPVNDFARTFNAGEYYDFLARRAAEFGG